MFGKNRDRNKGVTDETVVETSPKFYNNLSKDVSEKDLKKYWQDNNYDIQHFASWSALHSFLKDESKSLAAKLEVIGNLDYDSSSIVTGVPIPDYFWQDTTLDRKIRAYCREKSQACVSVPMNNRIGADNSDACYQKLVYGADDELFLGICELHNYSILLESEKVTMEQKELILRNAINFKQSYSRQEDSSQYILLKALENDCISLEMKAEIYPVAKQNMLQTTNYVHCKWVQFFNRFYSDDTISQEDKIRIASKVFPAEQGNNYSERYVYYIGNEAVPSYIQEMALNHLVNASGYNLEHSHPETFKHINPTSFVALLKNQEISFDMKLKLINVTNNPIILCYAMMDEELDDTIAELSKTKLETLKISETKELLEIMKTLISNPEVCQKRLIK